MTRRSIRIAGNVRNLPGPLWDSAFLRTCRGEPAAHTPVWLMRQAGRYMKEYREVRGKASFLELCKDPALACEVTLFARQFLGVDAAIIFSDILLILETLGLPLVFSPDDGPQLTRPIRSPVQIEQLGDPNQAAADLDVVYRACRLTALGLPADIPLIGFCGAPFTLASYAIEGHSPKQSAQTRRFMYRNEDAWHRLLRILVDALSATLKRQIEAGASCVQIFDSWVGGLTRTDFATYVQPHLSRLVAQVPEGIPVILFGTSTGHLVDLIAACGADVIGIDTTTDLVEAWARTGGPERIAVQGNLDPGLLLADRDRVLAGADVVLGAAAGRPGHIFNLGHGVLKESDPELAKALVDHVHAASARRR